MKYNIIEIPKSELSAFAEKKDFKAINVTIPYKEKVIPYLDFTDDAAKEIGAVNTIINENGRLYRFIQRNKVKVGDKSELISPSKIGRAFDVCELYLPNGEAIESAPHPSMIFWCRVPFEVNEGDIMRGAE